MHSVLITGANRGIGLALARKYMAGGWRVFACCRDPDMARELRQLAAPGRLSLHKLEVTDPASVAALAKELEGQGVDILINNAGVGGGDHQTFADMDYAAWAETLSVNTLAPLRVSQAFLGHLKRAKEPKIITISSMMGSLGRNTGDGYYAYRTSKAAVNKVMQLLALDLAKEGVIACPIHPGWVRTDMGGSGADISPEESAEGIFKVVSSLKAKDSGRFLQWSGEDHPW